NSSRGSACAAHHCHWLRSSGAGIRARTAGSGSQSGDPAEIESPTTATTIRCTRRTLLAETRAGSADSPRPRVAFDLPVEARVAVGEVLERDVETGVQGAVERSRLRGVRAHRRIPRILVDDVVPRPPAAHVGSEDAAAAGAARTSTRAR